MMSKDGQCVNQFDQLPVVCQIPVLCLMSAASTLFVLIGCVILLIREEKKYESEPQKIENFFFVEGFGFCSLVGVGFMGVLGWCGWQ